MRTLTISQARNSLPSLLNRIISSREGVVVARHGKPIARIVPFVGKHMKDKYPLRSVRIRMDKDFNKPMPGLWSALQ